MYLRQTRRTNRDGSRVSYLQLAHNERHPVTGAPTAKVIHNFGRAEQVDRDALSRLVASISRFLTPEQAASAVDGTGGQVAGPGLATNGRGVDAGAGVAAPRSAASRLVDAWTATRSSLAWLWCAGDFGGLCQRLDPVVAPCLQLLPIAVDGGSVELADPRSIRDRSTLIR